MCVYVCVCARVTEDDVHACMVNVRAARFLRFSGQSPCRTVMCIELPHLHVCVRVRDPKHKAHTNIIPNPTRGELPAFFVVTVFSWLHKRPPHTGFAWRRTRARWHRRRRIDHSSDIACQVPVDPDRSHRWRWAVDEKRFHFLHVRLRDMHWVAKLTPVKLLQFR